MDSKKIKKKKKRKSFKAAKEMFLWENNKLKINIKVIILS